MSLYFPQAVVTLRILWEDFGTALPAGAANSRLNQVYTMTVLPKRLNVNLNDYTTADKFDCELDYKSFPFDPRSIRSCGVTIHLDDMEKSYRADGSINEIVPTEENVIFQGFVDEESIELDAERRTVRFEGRDFTSLFIDAQYLEGKPLDTGLPLDTLLTQLISKVRGAEKIRLDNRTGRTLPVVKTFAPDFGQPLAGQKSTGRDDTYWEIMQDLAAKAGLIIYMELDRLVISTPRVLYDKSNAKRFIYGHNLRSLSFKRKLGRHKNFNVTVRFMDLINKRVDTATIPEQGTEAWSKATGIPLKRVQIPVINSDGTPGPPKDAPALSFRVSNVRDHAQLIEIGQKIFEEMSRQQIEGEFVTNDMETMDRKNNCFDLLKLRIGMPVAIELDQGDLEGLNQIEKSSVSTREKFLKSRGYEPAVARVLAETLGKFTPVFYTKAANFTMDQEQGFSLKVEFINFIDLDNKGINFG